LACWKSFTHPTPYMLDMKAENSARARISRSIPGKGPCHLHGDACLSPSRWLSIYLADLSWKRASPAVGEARGPLSAWVRILRRVL
jgi:hypothetical protein